MKIELTQDLPIERKHGCLKGKTYEVTKIKKTKRSKYDLFYFNSDETGDLCAAYRHEMSIIAGEEEEESLTITEGI